MPDGLQYSDVVAAQSAPGFNLASAAQSATQPSGGGNYATPGSSPALQTSQARAAGQPDPFSALPSSGTPSSTPELPKTSTTNPLLPNPLTPPTLANDHQAGGLQMPSGDAGKTVFDPASGKQVSPAEAAYNATKAANPTPPQSSAEANPMVNAAITQKTPPNPADTTSPAVDNFYNTNETMQQNAQDLMNYLSPAETTKTLTDQLTQITKDQNVLAGLNAQMMNINNVMNGTPDDIRAEVQTAGGFATESQVMALSTARNKTLLLQANVIQNSITTAQNAIANDQTLYTQEKDLANTQFSQRSSAYQMAQTNYNQMVSAQKDAANTVISAIGYKGYYDSLQAQGPQAVANAEKALGLGAGGLESLVNTQSQQQNANAIANAGITTPFVNKNGEIQSATGYAYTSPQDFFNKTGMTIQQAQAKGQISAMQPSLDIQAKEAQIAASKASAANSYASMAKTKAETAALTNPTSDNLNTVDPTSNSIMAQTGLSYNAFLALTGQMSSLPRDKATRDKATAEVQAWANKNGIDVSTFASQYKALNDTLGKNISRANNTQIFAGEVSGTVDQFVKDVGNDLSKINFGNVAKIWAGQQVNDKTAQKYAFDLQTMKNDLAGYYAASRGNASPDDADKTAAENVLKNGLDSGSAQAFKDSITTNEGKVTNVVNAGATSAQKQIWDLFGVGNNFGKTGVNAPSAPLNIGSTGIIPGTSINFKIIQ